MFLYVLILLLVQFAGFFQDLIVNPKFTVIMKESRCSDDIDLRMIESKLCGNSHCKTGDINGVTCG